MTTPSPLRARAGKWLAGAFLLLAAGIGALWYSALSAYEAAVLRERGRQLAAVAELKIDFVRFWLEEKRSSAAVLADRLVLAGAIAPAAGRPGAGDPNEPLRQLEAFRRAYACEAVLLLDRQGSPRLAVGATGAADQAAGDAAASAMLGRAVTVSSAHRSASSRGARIDIAAPVFDRERPGAPVVGALVFRFDPKVHLDTILRRWPTPSESGETFLVERSDGEIVYLSSLRHADADALRRRVDEPDLPAAFAARGREGLVEGIDYRGVAVLAAVGRVPDMPWYVVAKLDREEVLVPVRREALWSGTLAALLALALGLAMLAWHRRGQSELALAQQESSRAALAASEARFRKLIDSASDLLVLFDREMRITYASPSVEHRLGRSLIGESIAGGTALVHPEDVGRVEAARLNALAHPGLPQCFEHRVRGRHGHWMIVEASFTNFFDDPDIAALSYVGHDVSERKRAEAELRRSEARLRALFDSAPVGIAIVDAAGRYLMVNRAQCRMLGYGETELLGRRPADFTHREDAQANFDFAALVRNGDSSIVSMEKRCVRKDGSLVWVLLTVGRIPVTDGAPLGTVIVAQDITERREAEAQRLEYARRQRDTLVREVHHRIKNHLQGLAGLLRQHSHGQPALAPLLRNLAAQVNAISIVHGLQGRTANGRISLRGLVTDIAAFLGGIYGLPLRLEDEPRQCFMAQPCPAEEVCKWTVAEDESVPVALVLNELLTNAMRHRLGDAPPSLGLACDREGARLTIRNPGRLPAGLDVAQGKGLGTGLGLVRSLMPPTGVAVALDQAGDDIVETRLELGPPVLQPGTGDQLVSLR